MYQLATYTVYVDANAMHKKLMLIKSNLDELLSAVEIGTYYAQRSTTLPLQ